MATKPENTPHEWASDHPIEPPGTTESDPGTGDVIEPDDTKKADGWDYEEFPPYEWFNWLFKYITLWLIWLNDFDQNHQHDGGSSNLSAPQIDVNAEIDWGQYGTVDAVTDVAQEHKLEHSNTDQGESVFQSDNLRAESVVQSDGYVVAASNVVAKGYLSSYGRVQFGDDPTNGADRTIQVDVTSRSGTGLSTVASVEATTADGGSNSVNLESGAFTPTEFDPSNDSEWSSETPEGRSLHVTNLIKASVLIILAPDGNGNYVANIAHEYNIETDGLSNTGDHIRLSLKQFPGSVQGAISDSVSQGGSYGGGLPLSDPLTHVCESLWIPDQGREPGESGPWIAFSISRIGGNATSFTNVIQNGPDPDYTKALTYSAHLC